MPWSNSLRGTRTGCAWADLQKVLEPYGVIGFEYAGGKRLGGGNLHRAFVLWDEDFVNQHVVARRR